MQKIAIREKINVGEFKENVDSWIKQIRTEFSQFKHLPNVVNESLDNIQHNYELVRDLKQDVDDLKQELRLMKAMQLAILKKNKILRY